MSEVPRPDPDQLLQSIRREDVASGRSKLRIFLGMSAGVGKTYAMLKAAQERVKEGIDVRIGVVETHGRAETLALTQGLPIISKKKIDYKGIQIEEMDLDQIIQQKPRLVLVDELAHTNASGSRHTKRYQDVLELLDHGIDVYTTLNVQHLESRKELVEKISGVRIHETVPDSILDRTESVDLIDITPTELLKRLQEGKVYLGDAAQRAQQNFFKFESLTALREIALRLTAERVDHELHRTHLQTHERLMVALSHSPHSERLIRATRRLAYALESPWIAVYVDTGEELNDEDQNQLAKNLNLAREMGADLITTPDTDVASALKRVARQRNVTQIIAGRHARRFFRDILGGGSLLDRMVRESWDIDVHILRQDRPPRPPKMTIPRIKPVSGFIEYWVTFWVLLLTSFVGAIVNPWVGYRAVGFVFLLPVLGVGMFLGRGPVLFAALSSALIWDYFFIPPSLTLSITQPEDILMCVAYLLTAVITGVLTHRIRQRESMIRAREAQTALLYEVMQDISGSRQKDEFLEKVSARVGEVLNGECSVFLKGRDGKLLWTRKYYSPIMNENELAVANWVFESKRVAGWSTETLSQSAALYLPMLGNDETIGVFVYHPKTRRKLALEEINLLHSVSRRLALSVERHFMDRRLQEAEKLKESERIHQTLLHSISHELRTPLTAISAVASALQDSSSPLAADLSSASDRLNWVIDNLLDMSRLESGAMTLKRDWQDIHDLIGVAVRRLGRSLERHRLTIDILNNCPLLFLDFRLFEHVLSNLLMNAATYTPVDTTITIHAGLAEDKIVISVSDQGTGIPKESCAHLFEKFYRVPGSPAGGTGLGLSIVKSIVELHEGTIRVENIVTGGAKFSIILPFIAPPDVPNEAGGEIKI